MRQLTLGEGGPHVSEICLGAMYFGTRNNKEESFSLLDQYIESGGNFIDTANIYAHWVPGGKGGESETMLGAWMRARDNRDRCFIATKVGFQYPGIQPGLRAEQIEAECHKSLKRLGIETIDLYYAHVDDRETPLEETLAAFDKLVRAGKVRFIGASNTLAWRLERARWISRTQGWAGYCCVQQRYTYLRPRPGADFAPQISASDDLLDYAETQSVRLLAYSPLLSGAYTRDDREIPPQYQGPDSQERLLILRKIAAEAGATPNQVIFAWMLQSEPAVIPLVAASTPSQMQENLDARNLTLSPDQISRLNAAGT